MVNETVIPPDAVPPPAIAIALSHAPAAARPALAALFALDARLGAILRSTREPIVGQMRLTWWHAALTALDEAAVPAEPVLAALARTVLVHGVSGADMAAMIDGWELLLDPGEALSDERLVRHAALRGGVLFAAAGRILGIGEGLLDSAGEGWALADLAANVSDPALAVRARALATTRIDAVPGRRWPRRARAIAVLALMAGQRADAGSGGGWRSTGRLFRLLLLGR